MRHWRRLGSVLRCWPPGCTGSVAVSKMWFLKWPSHPHETRPQTNERARKDAVSLWRMAGVVLFSAVSVRIANFARSRLLTEWKCAERNFGTTNSFPMFLHSLVVRVVVFVVSGTFHHLMHIQGTLSLQCCVSFAPIKTNFIFF